MRKVSILLLIAWLLIAWDVTFVWWMGDGLEDLSGERRTIAEEFLSDAPVRCLDHPIMDGLTRHLHVSVGQEQGDCSAPSKEMRGYFAGCTGASPAQLHSLWSGRPPVPHYDVWVDVYSVLGLPLTRISQEACKGVVWCIPRE